MKAGKSHKFFQSWSMNPASPPPSCTNFQLNMTVVTVFFGVLWLLASVTSIRNVVALTMAAMAIALLPLCLIDIAVFKVHRHESTGLGLPNPYNLSRTIVKFLGLLITLGLILFCYWLFPEYHGNFYDRFYKFIRYVGPFFVIGGFIYFLEVDRRMKNPYDAYWQLGSMCLGRFSLLEKRVIVEHARQWAIKAFFFPLMFTGLIRQADYFLKFDYATKFGAAGAASISFLDAYNFAFEILYGMDLVFACMGYFMTFRLLDSHIRTAEPTLFGWLVAIVCYQPFYGALIQPHYLKYEDDITWGTLFNGSGVVTVVWGGSILALLLIYSLATVAMGYRFSNLTYRGTVTAGPYRYTKHPAYISKVLTWWLISVPFISQVSWLDAIRNSSALAILSFIYFLRAKTEEWHLSRYSEYVTYSQWINENGIFRKFARLNARTK